MSQTGISSQDRGDLIDRHGVPGSLPRRKYFHGQRAAAAEEGIVCDQVTQAAFNANSSRPSVFWAVP